MENIVCVQYAVQISKDLLYCHTYFITIIRLSASDVYVRTISPENVTPEAIKTYCLNNIRQSEGYTARDVYDVTRSFAYNIHQTRVDRLKL